jgi:hypothetical protein
VRRVFTLAWDSEVPVPLAEGNDPSERGVWWLQSCAWPGHAHERVVDVSANNTSSTP